MKILVQRSSIMFRVSRRGFSDMVVDSNVKRRYRPGKDVLASNPLHQSTSFQTTSPFLIVYSTAIGFESCIALLGASFSASWWHSLRVLSESTCDNSYLWLIYLRALTLTTHSDPELVRRAQAPDPSDYPYGTPLTNEMKYLGYEANEKDPKYNDHKAIASKLHRGFEDMVHLAKLAYDEADKKSDIFKRWFNEGDAEKVKSVFQKIVDPTGTGSATPLMKDWVNLSEDDDERDCDDPTTNAWTYKNLGWWHMCRPQGQDKPENRNLGCKDIDGFASKKMRSVGSTMLHEAT